MEVGGQFCREKSHLRNGLRREIIYRLTWVGGLTVKCRFQRMKYIPTGNKHLETGEHSSLCELNLSLYLPRAFGDDGDTFSVCSRNVALCDFHYNSEGTSYSISLCGQCLALGAPTC